MEAVKKIMDRVYGAWTASGWKPKPFAENKSRYLWTDAFGVVNYLTLYKATTDESYLQRAKLLIEEVHNSLGRSRDGKKRLGASTDERPLLGGLRIGKPHHEGPSMSEDGQYYHYLTKWMFALSRTYMATDEEKYLRWAVDLAQSVHKHFVRNVDVD